MTEDMQAIAAGMWVSGASMTQIAVAVGSNRNIVAGRIMRLRAADEFSLGASLQTREHAPLRPSAPRNQSWRGGGRRPCGDTQRGRRRTVRRLGAAATTVLEAREPETPNTEPQFGLPLWELEAVCAGSPLTRSRPGKGLDLQFCGRPVAKGVYCQACSSRAYDPRGCRQVSWCGISTSDYERVGPTLTSTDAATKMVNPPLGAGTVVPR